ncbi:hypothetical protein [Burkholderia pseudomallei]|uniref:hypothetical protein n=1 Tax=Burkholderia pseudomallei TaxID=28450 RepID=UPI0004F78430|nr:hypothetical protein [Burkholderia pseudomallei]AIP72194.1 hypothetical protein DU27_1196 [Burkholderia pseudomallei]AJW91488.1 flavin-containing monooxygenase FMO:FAD-dependent pyridine nucleotide-disulfide oxidoreductase domain protein [Burkholderia pseudomallei 406e]CAJ3954761.1 putative DNA-binding protein [Burkholderia pseudomallei]CAJ4606766.1 putative DNA-binding protein [Burkholderia pseudomallei]CAJ4876349.1 putative DNA-binding protein [Burkholderia pseudomallei]
MDPKLPVSKFNATTDKFAEEIHVLPQSVRKRYSATGSYFGIVPIKAPNGRLWWPDDSRERLLSGVHPVEPVEDYVSQPPQRAKRRPETLKRKSPLTEAELEPECATPTKQSDAAVATKAKAKRSIATETA